MSKIADYVKDLQDGMTGLAGLYEKNDPQVQQCEGMLFSGVVEAMLLRDRQKMMALQSAFKHFIAVAPDVNVPTSAIRAFEVLEGMLGAAVELVQELDAEEVAGVFERARLARSDTLTGKILRLALGENHVSITALRATLGVEEEVLARALEELHDQDLISSVRICGVDSLFLEDAARNLLKT